MASALVPINPPRSVRGTEMQNQREKRMKEKGNRDSSCAVTTPQNKVQYGKD